MSTLSREDVLKLARLSRLTLTDEEVERYQKELSEILNYVAMLNNADVSGEKPTYQVTGLENVTRKDEIRHDGPYAASQNELLNNAPRSQEDQFKVSRMIG